MRYRNTQTPKVPQIVLKPEVRKSSDFKIDVTEFSALIWTIFSEKKIFLNAVILDWHSKKN